MRDGTSWQIRLNPVNLDCEAIVLTGGDEGALQVVAEVIEVLETAREGSG